MFSAGDSVGDRSIEYNKILAWKRQKNFLARRNDLWWKHKNREEQHTEYVKHPYM